MSPAATPWLASRPAAIARAQLATVPAIRIGSGRMVAVKALMMALFDSATIRKTIVIECQGSSPAIRRSRVDFPDPLRPTRPTASPGEIPTETSCSAHTS